ncbi:hypothetical protein K435DRAFT_778811 [Dendrothele bispora CBS 962.96]|uniref:Uncharacterized protein n=1 Tax=Dendrothele bispora (strain CBS 962.96) TaxID=1314807 RepID=A0A4V4HFR2_DENBC|nr:hypothetical protein K435DRAFT_778811 [Dendrothele bispora CBS 962.96]
MQVESPEHALLQCMLDRETVEWRQELREVMQRERNWEIPVSLSSEEALDWVRRLIFDWEAVHEMAKFVYRVGKRWSKIPMYRMSGLLEEQGEN